MLILGLVFLMLASVAAAFIPACPFKSSLTSLIKLLFKLFPDRHLPEWMFGGKLSRMSPAVVRVFSVTLASVAVIVVMIICVLKYTGAYYALICFPFAAGVSIFGDPPRSDQRPPKYGIQYWIFLACIVIAPVMVAASYFSNTRPFVFIGAFSIGSILIAIFSIAGTHLFKFTPDTREGDAVAWLLKWTPSQEPSYFQKAGQISKQPKQEPEDEYAHRKAFLLTSLLPLLSSLITSKIQYRASQQEGTKDQASQEKEAKDLAIYVACLAQLSAFKDSEEPWWKNKSAVVHPSPPHAVSLVESLETILKTVEIEGEPNSLLRSAAEDALQYYRVEEKSEAQDSV
jgi:hypothetical protein